VVPGDLTGWAAGCHSAAAASKPPQPSPQQGPPMALGEKAIISD